MKVVVVQFSANSDVEEGGGVKRVPNKIHQEIRHFKSRPIDQIKRYST